RAVHVLAARLLRLRRLGERDDALHVVEAALDAVVDPDARFPAAAGPARAHQVGRLDGLLGLVLAAAGAAPGVGLARFLRLARLPPAERRGPAPPPHGAPARRL